MNTPINNSVGREETEEDWRRWNREGAVASGFYPELEAERQQWLDELKYGYDDDFNFEAELQNELDSDEPF